MRLQEKASTRSSRSVTRPWSKLARLVPFPVFVPERPPGLPGPHVAIQDPDRRRGTPLAVTITYMVPKANDELGELCIHESPPSAPGLLRPGNLRQRACPSWRGELSRSDGGRPLPRNGTCCKTALSFLSFVGPIARGNGPCVRGALPRVARLLPGKGGNVKTTTPMAAIAALVLASVALPAHADHVRRTYEVVLRSSVGMTFTDCCRFDQPQSTVLTIDGLGSILYTHGALGNRLTHFKGVGAAGNAAISFFGRFRRNFRRILGEGVNSGGVAFVFSGRRREGCVRSSVDSGSGALGSPYLEAE